MKKILLSLIAAVACLVMTSCTGETTDNASQSSSATSTSTSQVAEPEQVSLQELIDKAKADGANWSVDQWKEHFIKALNAYKPFATEFGAIMSKIENGEGDAKALMDQAKELEKKYPDYPKLMNQLEDVAKATANGKALLDNPEWLQNKMEELGIEHF